MRLANIVFVNNLFVLVIGATLEELKEALQTRQKIWTTHRSYHVPPSGHKHKCIYFEVRLTQHSYYIIDLHYEEDNVWKSQRDYAKILRSPRGPVMRVGTYIGRETSDYILYLWVPEERCAVLLIVIKGKVECEMQTWEDHVRRITYQCRRAYESRCGRRAYPVYNSQCAH
uniref:Putative group i salivary lipocalin n=1 Tax=Rhipicephalus pulchellus TaxID=72859 RepID=L7LTA0_RHIPC